jgi:hypothetical protein
MTRRFKFGALSLIVALMLHPAVGLATCWQKISDRTNCQGECPMNRPQSPCHQNQSPKPSDQGNACCQVSATPSSTQAITIKPDSSGAVTLADTKPRASIISAEPDSTQQAANASIIRLRPSLQVLYSVFLI